MVCKHPALGVVAILVVFVQRLLWKQTQFIGVLFPSLCDGSSSFVSITTNKNNTAQYALNAQCNFFLAESSIPKSGLGVYTAIDIPKDQPAQPTPDICLYVTDAKVGKSETATHTWQDYRFGAQTETDRPERTRAACQGLVTMFNSMPNERYASARPAAVPELIHTHGGLRRQDSPGAGAITHYFGASSKTLRDVTAGTELTLWDGTWDESSADDDDDTGNSEDDGFDDDVPPIRSTDWLRRHGMCIDHIRPGQSNIPDAGRGAFASRSLPKGSVAAPSPLQLFRDRNDFAKKKGNRRQVEELFINYCFQPRGSKMLLYPYAGFGLINHSSDNPNVEIRWSTSHMNHAEQWLGLPMDQFWHMLYPGALMIEAVAIRDIEEGEEILMDYGIEWEDAWNEHAMHWKPPSSANDYVYPTEMDPTKPFRTVKEQKKNPYAPNLMTMCNTYSLDRKDNTNVKWRPNDNDWPQNLVDCEVLARTKTTQGSYVYNVSLWGDWEADYFEYNVPQEAIAFADRPYQSDQHLRDSFRHPIVFPDELTPALWRK